MDVKEASRKAGEALERIQWKKDTPTHPSIFECYSGTSIDAWVCSILRTERRTRDDQTVPVFDGAAAQSGQGGQLIRLTTEQAEHAFHLARKQLGT